MADQPQLSDSALDDMILQDFPAPIALAYRDLLKAENADQQCRLIEHTYSVLLRFICLTLITRYITDIKPSDRKLSEIIGKTLNRTNPQRLINLLALLGALVQTYKRENKSLFFQEISTRWDSLPAENIGNTSGWTGTPWTMLLRLASALQTTESKITNPASTSSEIMQMFRDVLRKFQFLENYELWCTESKKDTTLTVFNLKGANTSRWDVTSSQIQTPALAIIEPDYYYIARNFGSDVSPEWHLIDLFPMVVHRRRFHDDTKAANDIGLLTSYVLETGGLDPEPEQLDYLILLAQLKTETSNIDLINGFRNFYRDMRKRLTTSTENFWADLRSQLLEHTTHELIGARKEKYQKALYIEREAITATFREFMSVSTPQSAMVITGDAGVGKSNVMIHLYETWLSVDPNYAVFWKFGPDLDVKYSVVEAVCLFLTRNLSHDAPIPADYHGKVTWLDALLKRLDKDQRLVLIFDAVNEHEQPLEAFQRINEFIDTFVGLPIKVLITTRPQVWRYVLNQASFKNKYKAERYFKSNAPETGTGQQTASVALPPYTSEEQAAAFRRYSDVLNIPNPPLEALNPKLRTALRDPLLLKFACQAFPEGIPTTFMPIDLLPALIRTLTADNAAAIRLRRSDIDDFLQHSLIPLFVPDTGNPTNTISSRQVQSTKKRGMEMDLEELITNRTPYLDGNQVNQSFQNLMNVGWLMLSEDNRGYLIRFTYEYLYDYFAGLHLLSLFQVHDDPGAFFEKWVGVLSDVPFFWGALRNCLMAILNTKSPDEQIALLGRLGSTPALLQAELVSSVLIEKRETLEAYLPALLNRWLDDPHPLTRQIAVTITLQTHDQGALTHALTHPDKTVRNQVVQDLYTLWEHDSTLVITALQALALRIRWRDARNIAAYGETLIYASMDILGRHYSAQRLDLQTTLQPIQRIWHSRINHLVSLIILFWRIPPLRPLTRRTLRLIFLRIPVSLLLRQLEAARDRGQVLVSIPELKASFPVSAERKAQFDILLRHIDAQATPERCPLSELEGVLIGAIQRGDADFLTTQVAQLALGAHIGYHPRQTVDVIQMAYDAFLEKYPAAPSPDEPTASLWLHILIFAFDTLKFADRTRVSGDEATTMLTILATMVHTAETRYFSAVRYKTGGMQRTSLIGAVTAWSYQLNFLPGEQLLTELVELAIERSDSAQLERYAAHLAENMTFYKVPDAAFRSLLDFVALWKGYLAMRPAEERQAAWKGFSDKLIGFAGDYSAELRAFVESAADFLPEDIQRKLINATSAENVAYSQIQLNNDFMVNALKDPDPAGRDLLRNVLRNALDEPTLNHAVVDLLAYVGNMIYGDKLFAIKG